MKLLQVSEADHGGGAERIAHDLHRSAREAGHDSSMLVGYKRGDDPQVTSLVPNRGVGRFCYRCLRFLEWHSGVQARFYWMAAARLRQGVDDWDIVHLHNLHGKYFNLELLPFLARHTNVIATLHDCWLFTGHCAYVFDCGKWADDCHPCCDIGRYPGMGRDAARYNLNRKRRLCQRARPVLVTPSQWLCDLARKSTVFQGFDCRVISNGIDVRRFRRGDQVAARQRLGLPLDRRIILYVVNGGLNACTYKDPDLLLAAVERLRTGPLSGRFHLVVVGGKKEIPQFFDDCISQVADTRDGLETFYQAGDLLAHPTKADSSSLVAMEAMSSGLPVVTTRVGGVPEVVEHGVTGYVTAPGQAEDFCAALEAILSSPALLATMGAAAVDRAQRLFSLERMTGAYLDLYRHYSDRSGVKGGGS
jgi:glycosyltransferase involved in cell wall biosynthesis